MKIKTIQLRPDYPDVRLQCYFLEDSSEFRRGETKPLVLIFPGGGYLMTSDREADPIAFRFLSAGYHACILRYSCRDTGGGEFPQPLLDTVSAMRYIFSQKEQYLIDLEKIAFCGFSAGANLAALSAIRWSDQLLWKKNEPRLPAPGALISAYGMLDLPVLMEMAGNDPSAEVKNEWGSKMDLWRNCWKTLFGTENPSQVQLRSMSPAHHVSAECPPSFIWHTMEDDLVYPQCSLHFVQALLKESVPSELHLFEKGSHGLSLADKTSSSVNGQINQRYTL